METNLKVKINGKWYKTAGVFLEGMSMYHWEAIDEINFSEQKTEEPKIYGKWTEKQMHEAFDKVKDKTNWKNPIDAVIPDKDRKVTEDAIRFFAGGGAEFSSAKVGRKYIVGHLRVRAPGYYSLIGA